MQYKDIAKPNKRSTIELRQFHWKHREDLIVAKRNSQRNIIILILKHRDGIMKMYVKAKTTVFESTWVSVDEITSLHNKKVRYEYLKREGEIYLKKDFEEYGKRLFLESI